jgi:hypothetical protein
MTRRELDALELGQHPAACLLAEQAPDDHAREHHITLVGGVAVSLAWGRALQGGRVP